MRIPGLTLLMLPSAALTQSWEQLPDFPGTARDDAALLGGEVMMVGTGMEIGFALTTDWYSLEASSNAWTSMPSLPAQPRQYASMFADVLGFFGGLSSTGPLSDLWWFDWNMQQWMQGTPLPSFPRYAAAGIHGYGSKCYIAGGLDSTGVATNELWEYDIFTENWTQLPNIPGPGRHRSHGFQGVGLVIVAGGADSAFTPLEDVWGFDIQTQQWAQLPSLPFGIYGGAFTGQGPNDMYILGGVTESNIYQDTVWRFMEDSTAWVPFAVLPFSGGRKGAVAAISTGWFAGVYFGTGIDSASVRHHDWYKLSLDHIPGSVQETESSIVRSYPNPVLSVLNLDLPLHERIEVRVLDGSGRCVLSTVVTGPAQLDLSDQSPGLYLLKCTDRSGATQHSVFIKI